MHSNHEGADWAAAYDRVMTRALLPLALLPALVAAQSGTGALPKPPVDLVRVPSGGIQPEVAVDGAGMVHMVYLAGEPAAANVFYVRSSDGGNTFSRAVRVNSQDGSAIATGTIRGAQLALGRNGRVHVAWNGSGKATPSAPVDPRTSRAGMPMLYSRGNPGATEFQPQRNLISQTTHLDGGGSIAADGRGHVYVAWHGQPADGEGGEEARRVWIARSSDDGANFAKEAAISDARTGVCGCCALRLLAARSGELQLLYRSAANGTQRDVHSLVSRDLGQTFAGTRVHGWEINACPMTSMSLVNGTPVLRAWETDGQVYYASADSAGAPSSPPVPAGAGPLRRKHPRMARGPNGAVLLAWADGTAWARGGSVAWQVFGADGRPTDVSGSNTGIPAWSFAAVIARPDGGFRIFY